MYVRTRTYALVCDRYQGTRIVGNVFDRINTVDPGDDVSAVYLDDEVSGFSITDNTFASVARAVLLGGGRSNVIANNTVRGVNGTGSAAVAFDNRGMGWAKPGCTPPDGELVKFLDRVPYQGALWASRFPELATILDDSPCTPRHNVVAGNTYCGLHGEPFLSASAQDIEAWGSTAYGNVPAAAAC
jgi:hypothetical protein